MSVMDTPEKRDEVGTAEFLTDRIAEMDALAQSMRLALDRLETVRKYLDEWRTVVAKFA